MLGWKSKQKNNQWVGLTLMNKGLAVAVMSQKKRQIRLRHCNYLPLGGDVKAEILLSKYVQEHKLKNLPCCLALPSSDYRLVMIDAINAPKEELQQAVRWRLKEIADVNPEDAATDVFLLDPSGKTRAAKKMYAVVSRLSQLTPTVELVESCGLRVTGIDIFELSVARFIEALSHKDSYALLWLGRSYSQLLVVYADHLIMARPLNFNADALEPSELAENLLLELQRSFDYCMSSFGIERPVQLFYSAVREPNKDLMPSLEKQLGVEIIDLKLPSDWQGELAFTKLDQHHCIPAIGAAYSQLQQEISRAAS